MRYHRNDDDAKHVLNQAFLNICNHLDKYKEEIIFERWAKRITINACIDEYRKNKKRLENIESQENSDLGNNSERFAQNEAVLELNAEDLRALIRTLPPISQQVFNLAVLDGYSYEEVAQLLKVSEATCRWHVHHSRKILQEALKTASEGDKSIAL